MRYRVSYRKRFNQDGGGSDTPNILDLADGVVEDALMVERIEPENLHGEETMDEDDDFLPFGTEVWEYDVAEGRDEEFKFAVANNEVVMECEEIEAEPAA